MLIKTEEPELPKRKREGKSRRVTFGLSKNKNFTVEENTESMPLNCDTPDPLEAYSEVAVTEEFKT